MSMRANANGQIESVKLLPSGEEHVSVIVDRQEIVDALTKVQTTAAEVAQDLAEYDAIVASQQAAAAPAAPATPEPAAAPEVAPVAPPVPETPAPAPATPDTPADTATPAPNPPSF